MHGASPRRRRWRWGARRPATRCCAPPPIPQARQVLGTLRQLRRQRHALGHLPDLRGEHPGLLRAAGRAGRHQRRWGLKAGQWQLDALAPARRALRPAPPSRTSSTASAGWSRSIPHDPTITPVKRTALGRAVHEGAAPAWSKDGRAVVFMGEDARFECIYRFVSRDRIRPGGCAANRDLLDHGTLAWRASTPRAAGAGWRWCTARAA